MGMGVKSKKKRLHTDPYKPGIKGYTGEPEPPVPHSFGIDNDNGLDMDSSSVIGNRALYVPPTGIPLGMPSALWLIWEYVTTPLDIYSQG